jgi:hypothetical protein
MNGRYFRSSAEHALDHFSHGSAAREGNAQRTIRSRGSSLPDNVACCLYSCGMSTEPLEAKPCPRFMRRHFTRRSLHLLWTLPLAFAPGYVAVSLARFERCGIDRCLGDPGGFASPSASNGVKAAIIAATFILAALALTPWLRPIWLRLSIGLLLSTFVAVFWIWGTLYTR